MGQRSRVDILVIASVCAEATWAVALGRGWGWGGWDYNLEAGLWAGISSHTFSEAKENAIQSENHTISIYSVL